MHLFVDTTAMHASQTFRYSRDITATSCDSFDVSNTVDVRDGDPLNPFATTTNTIHVNVHCAPPPPPSGGCTFTQGYWKTHSTLGPAAKPDATWDLVGGPNATFFTSGQTWLQVFNTAPAGGNVYYILAHQWMAATLNTLAGASTTAAVDSALAFGQTFFSTYTPATAGALKGSAKTAANAAASTLGSYNEGEIGPGHCDE